MKKAFEGVVNGVAAAGGFFGVGSRAQYDAVGKGKPPAKGKEEDVKLTASTHTPLNKTQKSGYGT